MPPFKNGANQARSRRLASERKSYQLTFHHDELQPDGFFCIIETRVASGIQKIFPNKWKIFPSTRTPLHRLQQPAKSILRRATASRAITSIVDKERKSLRFAPRVNHRFYIKNSEGIQQLVKLSWDGSGLGEDSSASPSSFDLVDIPSSPEGSSYDGIKEFIDSVNSGWSVQKIITILQEDVDRTQQDPSLDDNWFGDLYDSIKRQLEEYSPSPSENLTQIHKLLSIYKHSESAIKSARAMKQWSRFEVTIESISNLHVQANNSTNPLVGEMHYSSDRMARSMLLGKLPAAQMACSIDYTNIASSHKDSKRYCLNHNFGLADEKPKLTLQLRQGKQPLGAVVLPCSLFRYFSTQPKKTYTLERQMVPESSGFLQEGAIVKFSIRKVHLKAGFLDEKRMAVATKIGQVIKWIDRFNKDNSSPNNGSPLLSANICGQGNVSLLHAAIYAQDVGLVETLMRMKANPYVHSGIGSAMTLALNQSDRPRQREDDKQRFDDMIKLMQGNYECSTPATVVDEKENDKSNRSKGLHNRKQSSARRKKKQGKKLLLAHEGNTDNLNALHLDG